MAYRTAVHWPLCTLTGTVKTSVCDKDDRNTYMGFVYENSKRTKRRSQWPRGLTHTSATARLLRLWVRIPPAALLLVVSVMGCQGEVSA